MKEMRTMYKEMRMDKTESYKKVDIAFSYVLILLPFLFQYKGLGSVVSLGELALMPFIAVFFIEEFYSRGTHFNPAMTALYATTTLSIACCCFLPYFSLSNTATMYSRLIYYALLLVVARKHFHYELVLSFYKNLVFLFAIYAIIQYFYHLTTGGYLPIYLNYNWLFAPEARAANLVSYYQESASYRISSLFLEPGYFALYSFPALVDLVVVEKGRQYLKAIVIAAALILSGSGAGVAGIFIILLFSFLSEGKKSRSTGVLYIVAALVAVGIVLRSGIADLSLSRVYMGTGGSFECRITNGWLIFKKLPLLHQIIGTGLNNTGNGMDYYHISTGINMWGVDQAYCASIFSALCGEGIIGFLALVGVVVSYFRRAKSMKTKCVVILFVFTLCYEAILFTYRFAFYLIILDAMVREDEKVYYAMGQV